MPFASYALDTIPGVQLEDEYPVIDITESYTIPFDAFPTLNVDPDPPYMLIHVTGVPTPILLMPYESL